MENFWNPYLSLCTRKSREKKFPCTDITRNIPLSSFEVLPVLPRSGLMSESRARFWGGGHLHPALHKVGSGSKATENPKKRH